MPETILGASSSELIIKKSRFLGRVEPARDRGHALTLISDLRRMHPTATHVCWALMAGGQSAAVDDGEPSGTAGRPMLEVLRHQKLEGVLASVVRYYGGINLGAGGLVRAYTDAIAQALKNATKVPIVPLKTMTCRFPFHLEGIVRNRIGQAGVTVVAVERSLDLEMMVQGPEDLVDGLVLALSETGQGRIVWAEV
jgi:uncharacterized YigZ family protein